MWIINVLLLMLGTVSAMLGISFYFRNRDASGKIRFYILFYGLSSALWCICYGLIGFTENLEACEILRKIGIVGVDGFLLTDFFLVSELSGVKRPLVKAGRIVALLISVTDYFWFAQDKVDEFIREGAWTTWKGDPAGKLNRTVHTVYIVLIFSMLLYFGVRWILNNQLRRHRRFMFLLFLANFIMLGFTLPDTFLPAAGRSAISTSGLGAAICTVVMWYGATQLNSFDIRTGNIKDRIFDFLEAGIIVLDPRFRISMVNRYAMQLVEPTGQSVAGNGSYVGKNHESEDAPRGLAPWRRRREQETAPQKLTDFFDMDASTMGELFAYAEDDAHTTRLWDKEGKHAYSVRVKSVTDDYGDPFCYLCVFLDVTDEVEAAKKLEIASRAKSRFLAQMSHEIRTPINAVLGMNEMILRETGENNILEYAGNIDSAGQTLLALINSILDFSKIEDGKMDIVPVQYDTASMINDLVNSVEQRADAKGLDFRVDVDESIPSALVGDDVRVSQVIMNLLTNAVKYTPKGSVTLTVKVREKDMEDVQLFVSVADTGIGIRQEDIGRLFESFERLDEEKNHGIEGTGLGISIVKNLLEMMGSRLHVESTYGKGSVFSFLIRQQIADATPIGDYEERIRKSHEKKSNDDLIHAPGARILVVDDNDMNLKVTGNLLRLCDIKPDMVSSGEKAVEVMREKTYDCVFLDHMMPGMDGIETLHKLLEEHLVPEETTVIALTANAVVGARESYLEAGFADYLSKPIELKNLVKKLKKYLPESVYATASASRETSGQTGVRPSGQTAERPSGQTEVQPSGQTEVQTSGQIAEQPSGQKPYDENGLHASGIDTEAGLGYCADDPDFYAEMLRDFTVESQGKIAGLEEHFAGKDWHQYQVQIHALKSVLRMLGAAELSDRAKALEDACKNNDEQYIHGHHAKMMDAYRGLVEKVKECLL